MGRTAPREEGGLLLQERTQLKLMLLGHANDVTLASDFRVLEPFQRPSGDTRLTVATHVEDLASDVACLVRGQVVDGIGDIGGLAQTGLRDLG